MANRPKRTLGRAIRDDFEEDTDVRFQPLKWVLWIFAAIVVISIVAYVIAWVTQPARTAAGVRERIGNADNALYQYEHFHDMCASVSSLDSKIAIKKDELAAYLKAHPDGDASDKFQAAPKADRLATELTVLRNQRADQVAQYNADSAKWNRDLFKDKALPFRLDDTTPVCN